MRPRSQEGFPGLWCVPGRSGMLLEVNVGLERNLPMVNKMPLRLCLLLAAFP